MRVELQTLLEQPNFRLPPGERVVLEALLALIPRTGPSKVTADKLRKDVAKRQGRSISEPTFRQRLKRLNDSLRDAEAPFMLSSAAGEIVVEPNVNRDRIMREGEVGEGLERHSDQATQKTLADAVQPQAVQESAKPERLLVMFSYAWLESAEQQKIQVAFFDALKAALAHPPADFANLPKIELWRDAERMKRTSPSDPQIDDVCREAFLGILLLSHRYLHRPVCTHESSFFLDEVGYNQPGKACITVPFDVGLTDVADRYRAGNRIWAFDDQGRTLIELWSRGDAHSRNEFVRRIARDIFEEAKNFLRTPRPPSRPSKTKDAIDADDRVARFAEGRELQARGEYMVDPRAHADQLTVRAGIPGQRAASEEGIPIVPHLAEWAAQAHGPRVVALLGEFGMGKTVTCRLLTQELINRRGGKKKSGAPLPVYFDLREIDKPEDAGRAPLASLIDDMLRRAGENPPTSKDVIDYIRRHNALVIFDGLDEVTNKLASDQAQRLYRELLSIVPAEVWREDVEARRNAAQGRAKNAQRSNDIGTARPRGPKILVSCRSHYFKDMAAQRGFLTGQDRADLETDKDIKVYFMLPFSSDQIREYLALHLSEHDVERAIGLIGETYNLGELAARPVLLRFIRETFPQIEKEKLAGRAVNISRLYDIFVDQVIERDAPKHLIPPREKKLLLADLALALHATGRNELSNDALDDWFQDAAAHRPRLHTALSGSDGLKLSEIFLQDLRNATLLVRPAEQSFRFAHTSIREYFLADAIYRAIREGRGATVLDIVVPSRETFDFVLKHHQIVEETDQTAFGNAAARLMEPGQRPRVRQLAFALWRASQYTLPRPTVIDLSGLEFFGEEFVGTEVMAIPFADTNWRDANLRQVAFEQVDLSRADFTTVDASISQWVNCRVDGADFSKANLSGSTWRQIESESATLVDANIGDAEFVDCRIGGQPKPISSSPSAKNWSLVRRYHAGTVGAVALGRVGARDVVVSGSRDGSVRLFDAVTGKALATLEGHTGTVSAVALGRVGACDVVVSGSFDNSVRLFDAGTGKAIATLEGHTNSVTTVALGRVGARDVVVSGSHDSSIRLFDAATGEALATIDNTTPVAAVALGRVGARDVIVSGGYHDKVRLFDAATGKQLVTFKGDRRAISSIALGHAGARDIVVCGSFNNSIRVFEAATGKELAMLEGHTGPVSAVALGRVGARDVVLSAAHDNTVRMFDAATGNAIITIDCRRSAGAIALGRVGARDVVVSGGYDHSVLLFDAATGKALVALEDRQGGAHAVAFGRVGARDVVVGSRVNSISVFDATTGKVLTIVDDTGPVAAVALGRVGARDVVVASSYSNTVRLFDAATGNALATLKGQTGVVSTVALGRVGARDVVVCGGYNTKVRLFDAASGKLLAALKGHRRSVTTLTLGRVGARDVIVVGSDDNSICLFDAATRKALITLEDHTGPVTVVALGRVGGRDIVASGSYDSAIRLFDAATGKALTTIKCHTGPVTAVALGRVGARDVVVSGGYDNCVRLFDAATGDALAIFKAHSGRVSAVAVGRVGARDAVFYGSTTGSVHISEIDRKLAVTRTLVIGPDSHTAIELVPDGNGGSRLLSLSSGAWRYWRAQAITDQGLINVPVDFMPRAK